MDFEFDPAKSAANKARHGVDFVEAQRLWLDEALIEVPAKTEDEPRFLAIGRMAGKHRSAVCVRRGERMRIISVRRAPKEEIDRYESE